MLLYIIYFLVFFFKIFVAFLILFLFVDFLHYFTNLIALNGVYSISSVNNFFNVGKTTVEGN